jgi:hypothetical protein
MLKCNSVSIPFDNSIKLIVSMNVDSLVEGIEYDSIVGKLIFMTVVSRLDIIYIVSWLSLFNTNPLLKHLLDIK